MSGVRIVPYSPRHRERFRPANDYERANIKMILELRSAT